MVALDSRSGKTFLLVRAVIIRASKVKSRHCILRLNFNHAKTSIWADTLPKVLNICFPDLPIHWNRTDYYITLPNGSEIWIAGLDDEKRVEKILGKEYSTLYFNECSQIPYHSVSIALTRLAEKNDLTKKAYFDENPPSKRHWSYWMFIKHINPENNTLLDKDKYASMVINPMDNIDNIDKDYVTEVLDQLPEKKKQRFRDGLFTDDSDGQVYYEFNRDVHVMKVERQPGTIFICQDFNVNPMTAVVMQYINNTFMISDEVWLENSDTYKMCSELNRRNLKGARIIPDSTGRNRKTSGLSDFQIIQESGFVIESTHNPYVVDRVNNINTLFKQNRIIIDPKCKKLIGDLEKVAWKNNELDKKSDPMLTHISDCLGYGCWKLAPLKPTYSPSTSIQR